MSHCVCVRVGAKVAAAAAANERQREQRSHRDDDNDDIFPFSQFQVVPRSAQPASFSSFLAAVECCRRSVETRAATQQQQQHKHTHTHTA